MREGVSNMKKLIYRRALRIAAELFARAEYCVDAEDRACDDASEAVCARCIRHFLLRKAVDELRTEGRM